VKKFIKAHINLAQQAIVQIKKEPSNTKKLLILKNIIYGYFQYRYKQLKELSNYLDPKYVAEREKQRKINKTAQKLQDAIRLLRYINEKYEHLNRQEERQFWADFYKDGTVRKEMFERLAKEIDRI